MGVEHANNGGGYCKTDAGDTSKHRDGVDAANDGQRECKTGDAA